MDLAALSDFDLVALHGGFGKASRASGRPKATLSRRVMDLEASLGVRLIERGQRSLRLTEEGQLLFERTSGLVREIVEAGDAVSTGRGRPRGLLRVSAPVVFSHAVLGGLAAEFAQRFPELRLDLVAEDRNVDLVEDGYDAVVRVNPRPDAALVGRRFARDEMFVVAPVSMVRPKPGPRGAAVGVPAVTLSSGFDAVPWHIAADAATRTPALVLAPEGRVRLSSLLMVRDAVRHGVGAALLPASLFADDVAAGRLAVWGHVPECAVEYWVLHASRRLVSTKVSAFVNFLVEKYPRHGP